MIYGIDVSAYQPNFDFAAARREGFDFAIVKSTEGTGWRSPNYRDQVRRATDAGMITAAYHYVRGGDVAGQVANIRSMVDVTTPLVLDVEDGAPAPATVKALLDAVRRAGYASNLVYVPNWFHRDRWGRPDLSGWGLAGNWHSEYPDKTVRRREGFTGWIRDRFDRNVGGLPTVVMQFAESLAVANYPNGRIDGNAFKGTREDLRALLEGNDMPSAQEIAKAVLDELEERKYDSTNDDGSAAPKARSLINMVQNTEQKTVWQNQRGPRTENRVSDLEVQLRALDGTLAERETRLLAAVRGGPGLGAQEQAELIAQQVDSTVLRALRTVAEKMLESGK